jgi:hypothetical protein
VARDSFQDVPLHHRRAVGNPRLGTSSTPVAESTNPAVKRFARGGHVEGSMSAMKAKAPEPREGKDEKKTLKMAEKPAAKADTDFKTGEEFKMKRGGHAKSRVAKNGGGLPEGDEFKKGGKVKHKYAKGGHVKHSGDKFHHPKGHVSHSEKHHYAEGGHVTKGVNKW